MSNITKIRIAAACSMLMGTTWIVGLFAVGVLTFTFQVIFCVLNSLQGFFIFVFYCARARDVRKEWLKFLGMEQDVGSSTGAGTFRFMKSSRSSSRAAKKSSRSSSSAAKKKSYRDVKNSDSRSTKTKSTELTLSREGDTMPLFSKDKEKLGLFRDEKCYSNIPCEESVVLLHYKSKSSIKKETEV